MTNRTTTSTLTACPICGETLVDGVDVLSVIWFAPRQWWVLEHERNGEGFCAEADPDGSKTMDLMRQSGIAPIEAAAMTRQVWRDAWRFTRGFMSGRCDAQCARRFAKHHPEAMSHALAVWWQRERIDPLSLTTDTAWGLLKLQGIRSAGAPTP